MAASVPTLASETVAAATGAAMDTAFDAAMVAIMLLSNVQIMAVNMVYDVDTPATAYVKSVTYLYLAEPA